MTTVTSVEEFRNYMLKEINLNLAADYGYKKEYRNKYGDCYLLYMKENCYEFGIADYSIPNDFSIQFDNPQKLFRFGIVYHGTTSYKLDHTNENTFSTFTPSSFFVLEENLKGIQTWQKGQHYHGIEITIYGDYLEQIYEQYTGKKLDDMMLLINNTYHYLPIRISQCLQQMHGLSNFNELNAIYLEGKILECLAILHNELYLHNKESFSNQTHYEETMVGNRLIRLTASDLEAIQKAYRILTENVKNPPTIDMLSKMVLLNSQKLKAGFLHHYHMTIGEYLTSLRMSTAAIYLCTTNDHVHDIAERVGYTSAASFIKMFKKHYKKTPLQYRLDER